MIIAGIDPGRSGGVATLYADNRTIAKGWRMPLLTVGNKVTVNGTALRDMLWNADAVVLEQVHSMPAQGVASSFQFGRMFGAVEGVVLAARISFTYVTPSVWKSYHGLSRSKRASLDAAKRFWPNAPVDWDVLANEGIAEAALIARWYLDTRANYD